MTFGFPDEFYQVDQNICGNIHFTHMFIDVDVMEFVLHYLIQLLQNVFLMITTCNGTWKIVKKTLASLT